MDSTVRSPTRRERTRIAVNAEVDERTVAKVLRGEFVRGEAGARAIAALQEAGLVVPASARQDPRATADDATAPAEDAACR